MKCSNGDSPLALDDVQNALDEMLFSGGSLNMKVLGAEGWQADDDTAG